MNPRRRNKTISRHDRIPPRPSGTPQAPPAAFLAAFPDWNPTHWLDTAEMSVGVALAYEWLYDDLPEGLRRRVPSLYEWQRERAATRN